VTKPLEDKSVQGAPQQQEPTAAEMSKKETVASALLRGLQYQEYEVRSAAEAMPEEKYGYRPAEGKFKNEKPQFGPAEVRTFAEQVKHVACSNFGFAAEFDSQKPPEACDKGGTSPAKAKKELLIYLRDSFAAIRKSLGAIDPKNMFDPIEGPYAGPNTRLGLATVVIWHAADHYGQMLLLSAPEQHCSPRQPPQSARIERHLLNCSLWCNLGRETSENRFASRTRDSIPMLAFQNCAGVSDFAAAEVIR
jgi:hypothetical protein